MNFDKDKINNIFFGGHSIVYNIGDVVFRYTTEDIVLTEFDIANIKNIKYPQDSAKIIDILDVRDVLDSDKNILKNIKAPYNINTVNIDLDKLNRVYICKYAGHRIKKWTKEMVISAIRLIVVMAKNGYWLQEPTINNWIYDETNNQLYYVDLGDIHHLNERFKWEGSAWGRWFLGNISSVLHQISVDNPVVDLIGCINKSIIEKANSSSINTTTFKHRGVFDKFIAKEFISNELQPIIETIQGAMEREDLSILYKLDNILNNLKTTTITKKTLPCDNDIINACLISYDGMDHPIIHEIRKLQSKADVDSLKEIFNGYHGALIRSDSGKYILEPCGNTLPKWNATLKALMSFGKSEAFVLDIGCWAGLYSIKLMQEFSGVNATLCNINSEQLSQAKLATRITGCINKTTFISKDWRLIDKTYDVVIMLSFIHYMVRDGVSFEDLERMIAKLIRPKGILLLEIPIKGDYSLIPVDDEKLIDVFTKGSFELVEKINMEYPSETIVRNSYILRKNDTIKPNL